MKPPPRQPAAESAPPAAAARGWLDRRSFLAKTSTGLGAVALTSLLRQDRLLARIPPNILPAAPHAPRPAHRGASAKNVLVIFCAGACSQLETWDYKPALIRHDGQPMPGGPEVTFQGPSGNLAKPQYPFRPRGQTGKMISDLVPHLGSLVDDLAFIHSLTSKSNTHGPAENFLSTGFVADGFPSAGAWITYALGSENRDLPAFVAIPDPRGVPQASVNNWGPGFLPAEFQGTPMQADRPIQHLATPSVVSDEENQAGRALLSMLHREHLARHPEDRALSARIASYELAARMQMAVPEVCDIASEPRHILSAYGADDETHPLKAAFARNCILARRLIEKGVRFVQLFNGAYASGGKLNWDGHDALREQYDVHGPIMDQPVAALITDLRRRGLLDETVVVWCTEFGRMPMFQKGVQGRDHNPHGFTAWLTGAGVRRGVSFGATDDLGYRAVDQVLTIHDLNATLLHLLGLDHEQLTYLHNGFERRLTDVHGHVIEAVLA